MTNKFLLTIIAVLLTLVTLITEPFASRLHNNILRPFEESHLETLFVLLAGSFLSLLLTLKFKSIFKTWLKKFFVWYFPLAYLLTFTFPVTGYTMIYRFDAAVLLSMLMVIVTVGFVLWDKVKK